MASAEENQQWVRDRIEEAGLTADVEAEALTIIAFREQMEGL